MPQVKMSREEKDALLLRVLTLYNTGHEEEATELGKTVPVEKFAERALGREFLEEHGYNTSELD